MIYLLATLFGLIAVVAAVEDEGRRSVIMKMKAGLDLETGVSLIPTFPLFPLLSLGVASLLELFVPLQAFWIFVGIILVVSCALIVNYVRVRLEFNRVASSYKRSKKGTPLIGS